MSKVYTFHKTVIGHLHVMNEFPCEDSSASFSAENGKYYIVVSNTGKIKQSATKMKVGDDYVEIKDYIVTAWK